MSNGEPTLDYEEHQSQKLNQQTLRKLFKYILKEKVLIFWGGILICLGTLAMLLEPRLLGLAIDDAVIPKRMDRLQKIVILFFGVECVRVVSMMGQNYLFEWLGQRVMQTLRLELFSHLQNLPVTLFDKNPVGRLVTRVTNDVSSLAEMFSAGFVTMFGNFLTVLGIMIWIFILNVKLALIATLIMPPLIALSLFFSLKLRVAYRNTRSRLSTLNAFLAENILGVRVVQLFCREKLHFIRFKKINQWYSDAQVSSIRLYAYFQPAITIAAGISMALVIGFGGKMAASGEIQLGVLVAFFSYILSLFQPLREIADRWNIFLSGMASAERIFSILSWETERAEESFKSQAAIIKGHIRFENVWFAYSGENWVLKDLSVDIEAGSRVGIVGHTGAGKTTLIQLLLRFYEVTRGRILIDGVDIREINKRDLRKQIGLVQQDVFLFSGSLWENINFGNTIEKAEKERIENHLNALGLGGRFDFEKELDERGSNLSMGERQLISFVRALSKAPAVWVLDEATASVDSQSESRFMDLLSGSSHSKTVIQIAHRLATVRDVDQILLLHKGVLAESGSHEELRRNNGLYSKLYKYQESASLQHG